jgi:hypothetical protein
MFGCRAGIGGFTSAAAIAAVSSTFRVSSRDYLGERKSRYKAIVAFPASTSTAA